MRPIDLVSEEAHASADIVVRQAVLEFGGALPLTATLASLFSAGFEQGLALGLLHPELGRRMLASIDHDVLQDAPEIAPERVRYLEHYVEGMDT